MDYYYALLDSYDLLKKRKFKLSVNEAEENPEIEGEEGAEGETEDILEDPEVQQELVALVQQLGKGMTSDNPGEQNGVQVFQSNPEEEPDKFSGSFGTTGSKGFSAILLDGNTIDPNSNENAQQMLMALRGGGEEDDEEDTEEGEDEVNPLEGEAQALQDQLFGSEEKEGMFTTNEEGSVEPSPYFPGYVDAEHHSRISKAINAVQKKEAGEEQGLGIRGAAAEDPTITDKLLASTNLDPEKAAEALETVDKSLSLLRDIHAGKNIAPDTLRTVAENVEVTPQGVMFNGVYVQFRTDSKPSNDMYRNMTDQINKQIIEHNKECPDKDTEAGKDCRIPEIKPPSTEGRGMDLSKRGPMMEHSTVLTQLAGSLETCQAAGEGERCKQLESRIEEEYETMLADGSMEEAQRLFKEGLCAAGQACLVSIEGADAAIMTELTLNYLVEEQGMDERTAAILVQKAAEMDDGGTRAMVLLVASTRGFNRVYGELDVVDSQVWGQEGSNIKGQKDDVRVTATLKSVNKLKEKIREEMNEVERKLEEAAKCAGAGVGLDELGKSQISEAEGDTGNVTFGIEQKARTYTTKGRTKMGEGTTAKFSRICQEGTEGLDPLEAQFFEANNKRIEDCGGSKKPYDGMNAHDAACSFQEKIDKSMEAWNSLAAGQTVRDEEGKQVVGAGAEQVRAWRASKADDADSDARAKQAAAGFAAYERGEQPTKQQKEAIKKIGEQLEQREISKELDKHTDADGTVTGEGLGYLIQRIGQDAGSLDECVKDVRGFADNTQRLGLINTTTYGTISLVNSGGASVTRRAGSHTFAIKTKEGEGLMGGNFERGQIVPTVHNDAMTAQDIRNKEAHETTEPTAEALVKDFLVGQAALLEKLIAQTT